MNSFLPSRMGTSRALMRPRRLLVGVASLVLVSGGTPALLAQDAPPPADAPADAAPPPPPPDNGNGNGNPNGNADGNGGQRMRRGNFNPEAIMAALRTRFGVTDDAEWAVISERIQAIMDLRRSTGGFGGFGGFGGMRGGRQGGGNNPEVDALNSALNDNLPDAEIKARLERLREVRKENEAKLDKARSDLLAILTVRQEAVAVMMGLVP